jgi:hypothetical protein
LRNLTTDRSISVLVSTTGLRFQLRFQKATLMRHLSAIVHRITAHPSRQHHAWSCRLAHTGVVLMAPRSLLVPHSRPATTASHVAHVLGFEMASRRSVNGRRCSCWKTITLTLLWAHTKYTPEGLRLYKGTCTIYNERRYTSSTIYMRLLCILVYCFWDWARETESIYNFYTPLSWDQDQNTDLGIRG